MLKFFLKFNYDMSRNKFLLIYIALVSDTFSDLAVHIIQFSSVQSLALENCHLLHYFFVTSALSVSSTFS